LAAIFDLFKAVLPKFLHHTKDHSSSFLTERMHGGMCPSTNRSSLYLKFWAKLTPFFENADFQSIFDCSASAVTPSEKKLSRIGNPLHAFQWA